MNIDDKNLRLLKPEEYNNLNINLPKSLIENNFINHSTYTPNLDLPEIKVSKPEPFFFKEEKKSSKKGFEAWLDKHSNKLAFIFSITSFILTIITIIQAWLLAKK